MGEGLKIKVRKWRVRIEVESQFTLQLNSLTSSFPREATLPPLGEGVASASEQRPGGLLLGREVTHFFMPMKKATKFFRGVSYAPEKNVAFRR